MAIKTVKAGELVKLLEQQIHDFGDLPVYMTDHEKNELPITGDGFRFAQRVAVRKNRNSTESETLSGRFFVISDL